MSLVKFNRVSTWTKGTFLVQLVAVHPLIERVLPKDAMMGEIRDTGFFTRQVPEESMEILRRGHEMGYRNLEAAFQKTQPDLYSCPGCRQGL